MPSLFIIAFFSKFVEMVKRSNHTSLKKPIGLLILDMSDCYTWSFPEFVPFCLHLYYFSSFKAFKTLAQA